MFSFYEVDGKACLSHSNDLDFKRLNKKEVIDCDKTIYQIERLGNNRRSYLQKLPSKMTNENEDISVLENSPLDTEYPSWYINKVLSKDIKVINIDIPTWKDCIKEYKKKNRINILAMGDVGSTLAMGLCLLDDTLEIGIYDRNSNNLNRWIHELNQIRSINMRKVPNRVFSLSEESLFDCDIFAFCASKSIPKVGSSIKDVRLAQYRENSEIIEHYAKLARKQSFKGIFAVISDPVDLLCMKVFIRSNEDEKGHLDYKGLGSDQIIGYGLGVMHARASYLANLKPEYLSFLNEGEIFGPHGDGLIVVNSLKKYDQKLSKKLTEETVTANLRVRELGYKPYVAPSLSSGAYSLLATLHGKEFYGSTKIGKAFIGCKLQFKESGLDIFQYDLPNEILNQLEQTYNKLRSYNEKDIRY